MRVTRARGVEANRVALGRVRFLGDVGRIPDVRGGAQRARIQEAHHPEASFGLLRVPRPVGGSWSWSWSWRLRGGRGGGLRHYIHLEAALRGAAGPQGRFLTRHVL